MKCLFLMVATVVGTFTVFAEANNGIDCSKLFSNRKEIAAAGDLVILPFGYYERPGKIVMQVGGISSNGDATLYRQNNHGNFESEFWKDQANLRGRPFEVKAIHRKMDGEVITRGSNITINKVMPDDLLRPVPAVVIAVFSNGTVFLNQHSRRSELPREYYGDEGYLTQIDFESIEY